MDRRDRRRVETSRTLVALTRTATAEHGINGFTVEEIADRAGISRRTFFNHFASKEDAVLGIPLHIVGAAEAEERFMAGGPTAGDHGPRDLSPTLLADLAQLAYAQWSALRIDRDSVAEMHAVIEREPRLLGHMFDLSRREEEHHAALVAQREGLPADDIRARTAASIVGHLSRMATGEFLAPDNTDSFTDILERHLRAARDLFASQRKTA